jgi:chemotaxis protein CheD
MEISTILGSCVSVCFFDPVSQVAGMNHFLLPVNDNNSSEIEKYGDSSMELMLNKMLSLGSKPKHIFANVFGGGELLTYKNSNFNIGKKNTEIALSFIYDHEIRLISKVVGGKRGRKVVFNTLTGMLRHKFIVSSQFLSGQ